MKCLPPTNFRPIVIDSEYTSKKFSIKSEVQQAASYICSNTYLNSDSHVNIINYMCTRRYIWKQTETDVILILTVQSLVSL